MFGTAEMTSSSAPHESANAAAISQRLQTPLGFVGADCHLGDGVVQVHQVAFVVGVRHHDDRAVRVCRQAGAGGAEQSFGQTTLATVANDDEVVVARQFDEHGCGISGDDQRRCLDACSSAMALAFDRISCASLCAALSSPMAVYVASNDTAA